MQNVLCEDKGKQVKEKKAIVKIMLETLKMKAVHFEQLHLEYDSNLHAC